MRNLLFFAIALCFFSCKHGDASYKSSSEVKSSTDTRPHSYKIDMIETTLHLGSAPNVCDFKYVYPVLKMLEVATASDLQFIQDVNDVLEAKMLTPKTIEQDWVETPCIKGDITTEIDFNGETTFSIYGNYISFLGAFLTYGPGAAHPNRSVIAPVVDANSGQIVPFSQIVKPDSFDKIKEALQAKANQDFDAQQVEYALEFVKSLDDIQFTATKEYLILHILVAHVSGDFYSPKFTWEEASSFLK